MLPVTTNADFKLLKFILTDDTTAPLKAIQKCDGAITTAPVKTVKPQQLVAGMVFRLLGLDALPGNPANKRLGYFGGDGGQQVIDAGFSSMGNMAPRLANLREFIQKDAVSTHGEAYKNTVAEYRCELADNAVDEEVVSFSKVAGDRELVVVYNSSETEARERFIRLHGHNHAHQLKAVYGYDACGHVHLFHGMLNGHPVSYIKVYLKPLQLVILKNY